jgi:hypothetical protein
LRSRSTGAKLVKLLLLLLGGLLLVIGWGLGVVETKVLLLLLVILSRSGESIGTEEVVGVVV